MKKLKLLFWVLMAPLCLSLLTGCDKDDSEPANPYFDVVYQQLRDKQQIYLDNSVYLNFTSTYIAVNGAEQIGLGTIRSITSDAIKLINLEPIGNSKILEFTNFLDTQINYDQGVVLKRKNPYNGKNVYFTVVFYPEKVVYIRTAKSPM